MVSFSQLLTLFAATAAVASPVPVLDEGAADLTIGNSINSATKVLEARAGSMYTCRAGASNNGQVYGTVGMDKAIGYFRQAGTTPGLSGYPKPFGNAGKVMKFKSGCGSDVWELPLLASGKPYAYDKKKIDNPPGPIRVYYTSGLKFCGIGAKENPTGTGNPHNCKLA
ncbi:hypothetical protein MAPG_10244 [Magnaporthiopsis poae ATCC 64411]|uniref:Uncharacterized protein n=1 Tax=Magnaporthiopsis poae (strain ATCC 64411 / 73-15) TaxID=644358 RepID=A0A0C4EC30_MAGP6|nr:hypothetical protein MAPG_10244 [Magnaporthiopsis poae ATCC 64411]